MDDSYRYPIGQQDFKTLRQDSAIYVDKTSFVEKIARDKSKFFFLARPRRFGKSLFLSTLRYFFEGRRELFKGLYIDSSDWDWAEYPVLRLDLNTQRYEDKGQLDSLLNNVFRKWESDYDVVVNDSSPSIRFQNIIEAAHKKTGRQVVILVDEYDKPLISNLNHEEILEYYRAQLASIYSNFKSSAEHIRLVFMTGVSRFSKLSAISDLNNINDISFDNRFADVCGITEVELTNIFRDGINALAENYEISYDDALILLKKNYDGYKFTKRGSDIYNPWSVLNCLSKNDIQNYWGQTGKPTIIAEALKNMNVDLERTLNAKFPFRAIAGFDITNTDPTPLLYQTGYLTIKKYDFASDTVTLGVPNKEVKESLFEELLPYYMKAKRGTPHAIVIDLIDDIIEGKPEKLVKDLDVFLSGVPYEMQLDDENNLHNAIYILLTLIGVEIHTEVHTSDGRIDLLIETAGFIYIIELKFDRSAKEAISQIEEKQYALPFSNDTRQLFKIGINFSSTTRHLDPPIIVEKSKEA